jgi:hypothetical protein
VQVVAKRRVTSVFMSPVLSRASDCSAFAAGTTTSRVVQGLLLRCQPRSRWMQNFLFSHHAIGHPGRLKLSGTAITNRSNERESPPKHQTLLTRCYDSRCVPLGSGLSGVPHRQLHHLLKSICQDDIKGHKPHCRTFSAGVNTVTSIQRRHLMV